MSKVFMLAWGVVYDAEGEAEPWGTEDELNELLEEGWELPGNLPHYIHGTEAGTCIITLTKPDYEEEDYE